MMIKNIVFHDWYWEWYDGERSLRKDLTATQLSRYYHCLRQDNLFITHSWINLNVPGTGKRRVLVEVHVHLLSSSNYSHAGLVYSRAPVVHHFNKFVVKTSYPWNGNLPHIFYRFWGFPLILLFGEILGNSQYNCTNCTQTREMVIFFPFLSRKRLER